MAFGRNAEGRTMRAGGWGYIFGDEGGAFDIVRQALRDALRREEGWGRPTSLRRALLDATGAPDANTLLHDWYKPEVNRQEIAALSKVVSAAADEGDVAAEDILSMAGYSLAFYAQSLSYALFPDVKDVPVAYIGGVFQNRLVRNRFISVVQGDNAHLSVVAPAMNPAAGAVLTALRLAGNSSQISGPSDSVK
jgi:N-acetylglucosamine kinase